MDVVHICLDEEHSFNHSRSSSQLEGFGETTTPIQPKDSFLENNYLYVKNRNSLGDSDVDISFKSTSEIVDKVSEKIKTKFAKTDSLTQSDKPSDGYETCMDESFSDDNKKLKSKSNQKVCLLETTTEDFKVQTNNTKIEITLPNNDLEDLTPTNSRVNIMDQFFLDVPDSNTDASNATGKIGTNKYISLFSHLYLGAASSAGIDHTVFFGIKVF